MKRVLVVLLSSQLAVAVLAAQEQKPQHEPEAQRPEAQAKAPIMSPTARLQAAKTIYLKNLGGSKIAYNVISSGLDGWGRYTVVEDPATADLIVDVSSPDEGGGGVSMSSTMTRDAQTGRPVESATTTRDLSSGPIRVVVRDARNKVPLWSASEQPKGAVRQKAREDNLVEAAQRLVSKFRQRVEPEPAQ